MKFSAAVLALSLASASAFVGPSNLRNRNGLSNNKIATIIDPLQMTATLDTTTTESSVNGAEKNNGDEQQQQPMRPPINMPWEKNCVAT